ncbi:MAG: hypothetical protein H0X17_16025 [Deltaproteobacteria bacterium]|nr:hypothetical protein [Deltaproteobacteria bacterium]
MTSEAARTEISAAVARVPADTHVLFTANVGELRRNPQFDLILGKIAKHPRIALLLDVAPCVKPILSGSEWLVFAAKSLEDGDRATLIVRGSWRRADIEACFEDDIVRLEMPDKSTMLQLRRVGWVDFIDDHTVYLSVREDLAAAQVHALVKGGGKGPSAKTQQLLAKLPVERSLGVIVDGSAKLVWPDALLPRGSDLVSWVRVGATDVELDVAIDTRSEPAARKLVDSARATFDPVFKDADPTAVGTIEIVREQTTMRLRGRLTSLMIGMISSAIP